MRKKIFGLFYLLILSTIVFAQEGEFVKSEILPAEWEYYRFEFSNGLICNLPVLKERTDFLAQKLQLETEENKFIFRFTYQHKNQLYLFLIATRGVIPGIKDKRGEELKNILEKQIGDIYATITADGFRALRDGNVTSLTNVTSDMSEVVSVPRYFTNNDEFIFFTCKGYQKKALRKGQDNSAEVRTNVDIVIKYFSWNAD
ncbi:MAG: hypothetical protein WC879_09000 [Melioribacteraceae bacterium]